MNDIEIIAVGEEALINDEFKSPCEVGRVLFLSPLNVSNIPPGVLETNTDTHQLSKFLGVEWL